MEIFWKRVQVIWSIAVDLCFQRFYSRHLPSSPTDLLKLLHVSNSNNHNHSKQFSDLTIIVTGATSGIGLHTAREFAMAGAHVVMACRNITAANNIAIKWREEVDNDKMLNIEVMELDLLSLSSVRSFAEAWMQRALPLDLLINNAGIYKPGEPQTFSKDGVELQMQVNHIAPSLLTMLLLPSLLRASSPRIVSVSSIAHREATIELESWNSKVEQDKFSGFLTYGSSKLVQLMFLKTLADKVMQQKENADFKCIAVHPGGVGTNIDPMAYIAASTGLMFTPAEGSRSVIFCAASEDVNESLYNGFGYYSYDCKPDRISPLAYDTDACCMVWQKTMEILRIDNNYVLHLLGNN
ncbi:dehydrogenase/reductase SDR family member FEY-like isoform X1 [Papaver somniferum]|uniref:dehydrogenase/reductase SDR family member FEY-like isoform X1 n=1 Tax=Papaver somniferum TaxID=3469 RepID=UPI000E6FD3C7|nr:dehydrogenase/reductase SDR family member FEY-like isoform X1 [Papaver somniferum]